jgi:Carboxypeptidase regulatory-like domain/TonB-dependent Receptor Plug Domain
LPGCFRRLAVALGLAALGGETLRPALLRAQALRPRSVIDGMVSDTNLVALAEATVSLLGSSLRVTTGENGRFRVVAVPAGQYMLMIHRVGYAPVSVAIQVGDADTLRLSFAMRRIAAELDTVVVSAATLRTRITDFDERRRLGFGTFITAEQIKLRNPVVLGDVLRGIPSITIIDGGPNGQYAFSTRTSKCPLQVVIDDVLVPAPANLANLVPPSDVRAIEVYSGPATIPLQYKPANSGCGVILIWTK